jgi:hypothetical protein
VRGGGERGLGFASSGDDWHVRGDVMAAWVGSSLDGVV